MQYISSVGLPLNENTRNTGVSLTVVVSEALHQLNVSILVWVIGDLGSKSHTELAVKPLVG